MINIGDLVRGYLITDKYERKGAITEKGVCMGYKPHGEKIVWAVFKYDLDQNDIRSVVCSNVVRDCADACFINEMGFHMIEYGYYNKVKEVYNL